jgi:Glycoside hydrolase family 44
VLKFRSLLAVAALLGGGMSFWPHPSHIGSSMAAPQTPPRFPAGPAYQATARVLLDKPSHPIRDEIYGVCGLPRAKLADYAIPITRWGGNPSSRYNWKINADNAAADWYFMNRGKPIENLTETGWLKSIREAQERQATTYQTVPMLGWVAKDYESYGFSVKKYGPQKASEPNRPDAGNGVKPDGKPVTGNDPKDTSIPAPPEFIAEGVRLVVQHAGLADKGGVRYWALDNEPMIWHSTHRDVHPEPLTYDALWERTVAYAEAIKKEDPTAKVAGFCSWGWTDLFLSAADEGGDRYKTKPDFKRHGSIPLAEWFIQKCGRYKKEHGKPLVDVFDFHWYPQAQLRGQGPYLGKGMDLELNELRLRTTRDLWDPDYVQESWIRNTSEGKVTAVIRRVHEWVDKHNAGMQLCLGEYNFGGSDNITGGLAQADVFGILAREKVDIAFIWHTPEGTQNLAWQLFCNYDGRGGRFGETFIPSESSHADVPVCSAKRKDGATTIAVINKNLRGSCELTLDVLGLKGKLRVWRFDQESGGKVIEVVKEAATVDGVIKLTLPAASASMLVVQ